MDKLVIAVAPTFVATRGPANESGKADFEYFVSVVGAGKEILNQQRFPVSIAFPGNRTRVEVRQDDPPVSIDIPLQDEQAERYADAPWNTCIKQKQKSLNPTFTGLAATFTGSFPLGSPETLNGPFPDPLTKPMQNSLRVIPEHNNALATSEICASSVYTSIPWCTLK